MTSLASRVTVRTEYIRCAASSDRQYRVLLDGKPIGAARLTPISADEAADIARAALEPCAPVREIVYNAGRPRKDAPRRAEEEL